MRGERESGLCAGQATLALWIRRNTAIVALSSGCQRYRGSLFQYVKNTEASSDDTGYEAGAGIGANKDPGDVAFTYAYEHLETDAVISAFSESDFGHDGGTNTEAHIVQLSYVLWKNLTFLSTAYFDEPIDEVKGRNANRDVRWQVDVIGKF